MITRCINCGKVVVCAVEFPECNECREDSFLDEYDEEGDEE